MLQYGDNTKIFQIIKDTFKMSQKKFHYASTLGYDQVIHHFSGESEAFKDNDVNCTIQKKLAMGFYNDKKGEEGLYQYFINTVQLKEQVVKRWGEPLEKAFFEEFCFQMDKKGIETKEYRDKFNEYEKETNGLKAFIDLLTEQMAEIKKDKSNEFIKEETDIQQEEMIDGFNGVTIESDSIKTDSLEKEEISPKLDNVREEIKKEFVSDEINIKETDWLKTIVSIAAMFALCLIAIASGIEISSILAFFGAYIIGVLIMLIILFSVVYDEKLTSFSLMKFFDKLLAYLPEAVNAVIISFTIFTVILIVSALTINAVYGVSIKYIVMFSFMYGTVYFVLCVYKGFFNQIDSYAANNKWLQFLLCFIATTVTSFVLCKDRNILSIGIYPLFISISSLLLHKYLNKLFENKIYKSALILLTILLFLTFGLMSKRKIETYNCYNDNAGDVLFPSLGKNRISVRNIYKINEDKNIVIYDFDGYGIDKYIEILDEIDKDILISFADKGWTIEINANKLAEYSYQDKLFIYKGLIDYENKTITDDGVLNKCFEAFINPVSEKTVFGITY